MGSKIRKIIFPVILIIADIIAIYISFNLAYWLRFYSWVVPIIHGVPPFKLYHTAIFVVIFLWGIVFVYSGFYQPRKIDLLNEFLKIVKGVFLGTVIIAAITFLYRDFTFSRVMLLIAFAISSIVIFIFHEIIRLLDVYIGNILVGTSKILILGEGKVADDIIKNLRAKRNYEVWNEYFADINILKKFIVEKNISEIIFSKSQTDHNEISNISDVCEDLGVDFKFVPDIFELKRGEIIIDEFIGVPIFHLKAISLHGWNFFIKRLMDVIISIFIFSIFSIPLIIIAVLIKVSDGGDVFYLHKNMVGYRWNGFDIFKFRTMILNPEKKFSKEEILHLSTRRGEKAKHDPRITKVGKFLRRFSLDEIPQFINVLRGEMSIVGPRPQTTVESVRFDNIGQRRFKVLPGITGLWQTKGRKNLSYEEMLRLDVYYLENWSIALDIRIMLSTIPAILTGRGAY
ncbi:MAG: sugar transferase [Elusimicrobia bacterium]|nr:sugar transferase [Elusimicrobiota bacterium]